MSERCRGPRGARAARAIRGVVALAALLAGCATHPLRVASSGDYPPFTSLAADGARQGLDVAIATRLAADLGLTLEWVPLAWPELAAAVVRGDFDVALSGVTMRADRALIGRYARPYALTRAVPAIRPGDATRWRSPADLNRRGVRIAVNAGGHLETVARQRFPRATIVPVADNRLAEALAEARIAAIVTDTAELAAWPAAGPRPLALAPLSVDDKAPLLPPDRGELAARIDDWLMAREADGWLDAQRVRALGESAARDDAAAARQAVAAWVRLRLALMPDVAVAKRAAGLPIEDREQEARVLARAREQVPAAPDRAAAVYGELIAMAKAAQQRTPERPGAPPSLATLRAALARIDESLCRELAHLPPGSLPEWRAALQQTGAPPPSIERLAAALAF
ncbi:transporter substrate-binding domain-containing protein [bacterium]|nr:transporter substrate-binding domain-containing protein [bacterium]